MATFFAMRAMKPDVGRVGRRVGVGDEVEHLRVAGLAVAVDAADPLLEARRVERDVEVDQPMAVRLQVDALPSRIGCQEHSDRFLRRVLGELRADVLTVFRRDVEPWITASTSP